MPEGGRVDTLSVCAVLVSFNWPTNSIRYKKIAKFVDRFFAKFDDFLSRAAPSEMGRGQFRRHPRRLAPFAAGADLDRPRQQLSATDTASRSNFDTFLAEASTARGADLRRGARRSVPRVPRMEPGGADRTDGPVSLFVMRRRVFMLSPSDIVVRPTNLTERLAAQAATHEPTPTTMAERFAPRGAEAPWRRPGRASGRAGHAGLHRRTRQRARVLGGTRAADRRHSRFADPDGGGPRFAVAGRDRDSGSQRRAEVHRSPELQRKRSCRARAGARGPAAPRPRRSAVVVAPEPEATVPEKIEVALTAPSQIAAKSGEEIAFAIAIDADGRAAGAKRHRHSRHARGRHLLARPPLRHRRVEPDARMRSAI